MNTYILKYIAVVLLLANFNLLHSYNGEDKTPKKSSLSTDLFMRIGLFNGSVTPGEQGVNGLDGLLLQFGDQFSNCRDAFDASKVFGPDENIFTIVDDFNLSVESRKTPQTNFNEIIDLNFFNLNNPQYKLYFEFLDDSGLSEFTNGIFLWDKCEDTYFSISDLEVITFDVNCNAQNSFVGSRFALVFKQNPVINDNSFNAIELTVDQPSSGDAYTTVSATAEINEPSDNLIDGVNGSVWFSFLAPSTGNVKVTTDIAGGTAGDTEIAVYSKDGICTADYSNYNIIGYDNNSGVTIPNRSILFLDSLNPGERYYIQVDGTSDFVEGTFGIEVQSFNIFTYNITDGYLPFNPDGSILPNSVLTVENGTAVLNQVTSLREITVLPSGVLDLNADLNSDILFKSDETGSAQFADASGTTVTGSVTVERYIPAGLPVLRRAFRFLTSSVNTATSINANWQEGVNNSGTNFPTDNQNPNPGFGIHISGGDASLGFDQTGTNNPSMFTFDNSDTGPQANAWTSVPNTNTKTLKAGEAYLTFVRGDRSINVTSNSAEPTNTTLRATGDLHIGSRVFSSANNATLLEYGLNDQAGLFSLVGNPFQAIVDINKLDFTNINSMHYWVWDPNLGTRGNYATVILPGGSNNTSSSADQFIQPGQSFFVQTLANGPASLTFNEDDKDVSGTVTGIFSEQDNPSIKMLLYSTDALSNDERESDGLMINFAENANNALDIFDADKLTGPDENLARLQDNKLLSIEQRGLPAATETLALSTSGYTSDNYSFVIYSTNIQGNFEAYLLDDYTGTQTQLNEGETQIDFTVDAGIPASIDQERFKLVFETETFSTTDNGFGADFSLYPNPTDGKFNIKTPNLSGEVGVEISNLLGQQVYSQKLLVENQQVNVNVGKLSAGVYLMTLTQDSQTYNSKLIIE